MANSTTHEIVKLAADELEVLEERGKHRHTGEVRKVSSKVYREFKALSFGNKLIACEELLKQRTWAMGIIAYDIAYRERKNYTIETFEIFEHWLIEYVRDWGDCDDFSVHALGALIYQYPRLFDEVKMWCGRPEFWARRAAAVSLIYSIRRDQTEDLRIFEISDALLNDEHYLVVKGYGWMLKEHSVFDQESIAEYLKKNVARMPRLSFRYALGKMDQETKAELMRL